MTSVYNFSQNLFVNLSCRSVIYSSILCPKDSLQPWIIVRYVTEYFSDEQ